MSLFTVLLLVDVGGAQEPGDAAATPVDPSGCTVEPRAVEELRALTIAGWPRARAALQGTPISSPVASMPEEPETPEGTPADAETLAAVQEIVSQIAACTNAGDLDGLFSLYDDEGAGAYLAVGLYSFSQGAAGDSATIDPLLLDMYLASLQLEAPLPDENRVFAYRVDSVTVRDDGLIYVVASFARGDEDLSPFAFHLRDVEGLYRIVFRAPEGAQPNGAPIATPQA